MGYCTGIFVSKYEQAGVSQKPGDHPNFRKNALRAKRPFKELSESSGVFSEQLSEFRNSVLRMRNSILGMASHDLSNTKTTILGATLGATPRNDGNPNESYSFAPSFRKILVSVKFFARNSGAGNGCADFMGAWKKFFFFLQGNLHAHKFLVSGGAGILIFFWGGGSADFSFMGARILEGPTRKPRHASVFSTHSDTQAVPAFHCTRMFKGIFSTRAFLKRTDTLSTIA